MSARRMSQNGTDVAAVPASPATGMQICDVERAPWPSGGGA